MPAPSLLASADDLNIAAEQARDNFVRGSHLSSRSCDSVRIHRSTSAVDVRRDKVDSHVSATDFASDRSDSLTTAFPKLTVTEPACAIRYVQTNHEHPSQRTASDPKVQWTTPGGQEDALGTTVLSDIGSLAPVEQLPAQDTQRRKPFYKWVKALCRRRIARRRLRRLDTSDQARSDMSSRATGSSVSRRNSSSISSLAYVSVIRDASISGASTSFVASSRKLRTRSSKRLSKTDRSGRASYSARLSEDNRPQIQADLVTLERSKHRRRILEELIETEEGYIGDIKFLMKVGGLRGVSFTWRKASRVLTLTGLPDDICSFYVGRPRFSSIYAQQPDRHRRAPRPDPGRPPQGRSQLGICRCTAPGLFI